jgi:hypothetical protein
MATDKDDKPMIEKNGFKFPAALRGLIENPPLLDGENPEHFWRFLQAVVEDQKPLTILDWVSAIDMAIKAWEELRLKRSSVALIHGGMLNALIFFLERYEADRVGQGSEICGQTGYGCRSQIFQQAAGRKSRSHCTTCPARRYSCRAPGQGGGT